MNKTIKGCLIIVIIFILIVISSIFLLVNNIDKSFQSDKNKVDTSWKKYTELLSYRNNILKGSNHTKILFLVTITEKKIRANSLKKDLLTNEYTLNDSLRKYQQTDLTNKKLNNSLLIYNANVKEFNTKYSSFPYSYLRIKKSVPLYDYFEIEYGSDNSKIRRRNQNIDNWIENGGELKIE